MLPLSSKDASIVKEWNTMKQAFIQNWSKVCDGTVTDVREKFNVLKLRFMQTRIGSIKTEEG